MDGMILAERRGGVMGVGWDGVLGSGFWRWDDIPSGWLTTIC